MQKVISFGATNIAQYIYQNKTSAIKEKPQETSCFSIFLDTQQNKNCSKVLSRHGTELWMPDFLIILFFGPSVMLTTDRKKWQIFRLICVLMKFDHISGTSQVYLGHIQGIYQIYLRHSQPYFRCISGVSQAFLNNYIWHIDYLFWAYLKLSQVVFRNISSIYHIGVLFGISTGCLVMIVFNF